MVIAGLGATASGEGVATTLALGEEGGKKGGSSKRRREGSSKRKYSSKKKAEEAAKRKKAQAIRRKVVECTSKTRRALGKGELCDAYTGLIEASKLPMDNESKKQLVELASKLNEAATKALADADKQFKGDEPVEAIRTYYNVSRMSKLKACAAARKKFAAAKTHKSFPEAWKEIQAAALYDKVEKLRSRMKGEKKAATKRACQRQIDSLLKSITRRFGDTPTGKKVAEQLKETAAEKKERAAGK